MRAGASVDKDMMREVESRVIAAVEKAAQASTHGKREAEKKDAPPKSPCDFIQQRMRELDKDAKDAKGKDVKGKG